jgi:hypothetical protein
MPAEPWVRRTARFALVVVWAVLAVVGGGCGNVNRTGELKAPKDARPWESKLSAAFDDGYTKQVVKLSGRAPNDVKDQQLFGARLGLADVVARVQVQQVWGRGRYQGKQDQYVEVEIEEVMIGELMRGTDLVQPLKVLSEDELPGALQGQSMILFVRWAPEQVPSYHHHLMPAPDDLLAYIEAMIDSAKKAGVLDDKGRPRKNPPRKLRKSKADEIIDEDEDMPVQ